VIDPDGRIGECNAAFTTLVGADAARRGAMVRSLLVDRADGAGIAELVAEGLAGTLPPSGHARIIHTETAISELAYTWMPQALGGAVLTLCDLPEYRRFQDFAEAANDWFWETDTEHRFVFVSTHDRPVTNGVPRRGVGSARWEIADTSEDPEGWRRHREDMDAHRPFRNFQYWLTMADGARHRISVSGKPIFRPDGAFHGYRGTATDITRRSSAEDRARRAETQLRDAIAAMEDGFVIYDADDRFVLSNARYVDLYPGMAHLFVPGTRFEDILRGGLACGAFVLPPHQSPEEWLASRLRDHWEGVVGREQHLGDGRWVAVKERRTAEGGAVGIRTEITEQKRREQSLRAAVEEARLADRVKSEFLANMSHELRTPLNAIIGFSEVMTTQMFGPLGDPHYADYAHDIHTSGCHLLAVISDILDLSRIEAGELHLDLAPVALADLVGDALRMVTPRADDKGLVLTNAVAGMDLPDLIVDGLRIKQVLLNLLSNAVKFTPSGGTVRVEALVHPDGAVEIAVADSGIGMSPEDLDVAMTPFGQVQSAFSRRYQGTGLGLPIAARLMEAHGGRLDLVSVRGQGTRASLVFASEAPAGDKK